LALKISLSLKAAVLIFCVVLSAGVIQLASAAALFSIVLTSDPVEGSGWLAGYVVSGSGTYTLGISATGSPGSFPLHDIAVIVCINTDAHDGGLQSLTIGGTPITDFTHGSPGYYGANGGPFSENDYWGYNDEYGIPTLSYAEGHYPDDAKEVSVTINFNSAYPNSKVMILCYGLNAQDKNLKTAFSNGTLFQLPEYALGALASFGACAAAAILYGKRGQIRLTRKS
jgi:hypothetical protein